MSQKVRRLAIHITDNISVPRIYIELQHFPLENKSAISSQVEDNHTPKFNSLIVVRLSEKKIYT